jgi:ribosome-binding factor A
MSRTERISHEIKKEISRILREDVSDPRIGFISLTDVDITPDLKYAKIFVSVLGDEKNKKKSLRGLKSATPFIKLKLGESLNLRFVPDIKFIYDNSLERGDRLLNLMNDINKEKH